MKLTKEEKELIRKIGHPYYTERHIQEWLNIDLQKTNQMKDYMRFTAAGAYMDAVRGMLKEQERRNRVKNNNAERALHAIRPEEPDRPQEAVYGVDQ